MTRMHVRRHRIAPPAPGVTLIELMIALVLGLIVSGAAMALFMTNRQTYIASESLGRVQENSRTAFELMARDVREAAGNPCAKNLPVANVLNSPGSSWWDGWNNGIIGYDGAAPSDPGNRVAGTDMVELKSAYNSGVTVVDHVATSAQFKVTTKDHGLNDGDIALVCDYGQASIFQVTNAQNGINKTIVHNTGTGTPGNCTKGLGVPVQCTANGSPHVYGPNAVLARLNATRWYIGTNSRGGRSLYQSILQNVGGVPTAVDNEITEGVDDMSLSYLADGAADYQPASAITDWSKVLAVRIDLTMTGQDRIGTDGNVLQRGLDHVVAIRNRAP